MIKIKSSCGGQGCSTHYDILPKGITTIETLAAKAKKPKKPKC